MLHFPIAYEGVQFRCEAFTVGYPNKATYSALLAAEFGALNTVVPVGKERGTSCCLSYTFRQDVSLCRDSRN